MSPEEDVARFHLTLTSRPRLLLLLTSSTEGNYRGLETFNCPVYSIGEDRLRESEEDTNSPPKPTIICPGQPRVILSDLLDNFREK